MKQLSCFASCTKKYYPALYLSCTYEIVVSLFFSSPVILRFPLKLHTFFVQPPRIVLVALAEWRSGL